MSAPAKVNAKRTAKGLEPKYNLKCSFCDKKKAIRKLARQIKRKVIRRRKASRKNKRQNKKNKKNKKHSKTAPEVAPEVNHVEDVRSGDDDAFEQAELIEAVESIPDEEINDVPDEILEAVFEDLENEIPVLENL